MYNNSGIILQTKTPGQVSLPDQNQTCDNFQGMSPEQRWKQEVAMHLHMKNQKKYTHLYQLEKYFK